MASERRKQSGGLERAPRGSGDEWSSDAQNLLDRAPQFGALAKAAAGQAPEPSPPQQEFLDDFAQRLTDGLAEGDDASAATAALKPARSVGRRARPKGGRT